MEHIEELYHDEYLQADTDAQKKQLARTMYEQATTIGADPPGQYMLLEVACKITAQAGDVETCWLAVNTLARRFQVDEDTLKLDTLEKLTKSAKSPSQRREIASLAMDTAEVSHASERYRSARAFCTLAIRALGKPQDSKASERVSQMTTVRRWIEETQKAYGAAERAKRVLEDNPQDPSSWATLGKYLCFHRNDWENGLPALARGNDPILRSLAKRELESPESAEQSLALGERWWKLAEDADLGQRRALQRRAAYWFARAIKSLPNGLKRLNAERRIQEVNARYETSS
jgi:hypothetical protein